MLARFIVSFIISCIVAFFVCAWIMDYRCCRGGGGGGHAKMAESGLMVVAFGAGGIVFIATLIVTMIWLPI